MTPHPDTCWSALTGVPTPRPCWVNGADTAARASMDAWTALRALANGGYVSGRVFFATESDAVAAGYRSCARCYPEQYRRWRE